MSYILSIGTASPKFQHTQSDILAFMKNTIAKSDLKSRKLLDIIYRRSKISSRFSALPHFSENFKEEKFFKNDSSPSLEKRMQLYFEHAPNLLFESAKNCLKGFDKNKITHVITVSCTGVSAPGLEIELIERLNLSKNIFRSGVNFMGCYAMFHALRQANDICLNNKKAVVLIAGVELCTLHFQNDTTEDNLMANAIFADGAGSVLVSNQKYDFENTFKIKSFYSQLLLQSKQDMAWNISSNGFLIKLSSYVPLLIKKDIESWVTSILDLEYPSLKKENIIWAFHPGGARILDNIAKALLLDVSHFDYSYNILKNFGNMSAVTILFILKSILENEKNRNAPIFSAGFGPGLTMEGMMLNFDN